MPTSFATWPLLGGTILAPSFSVGMDISEGRLIALLTDWRTRELPIQALYPHRLLLSAKVRSFVDFLAQSSPRYRRRIRFPELAFSIQQVCHCARGHQGQVAPQWPSATIDGLSAQRPAKD